MKLNNKNKIAESEISEFEKLFKKYYKDLCYYASGYLHDFDLAQETVQEIFFNLWKNKSNLKTINSSYLYIATKNQCLKVIRKSNNNKKYLHYLKSCEYTDEPTPFDYLKNKELKAIIENTLTKMPEQIRKIFLMSRNEGLKYSEIANQLSISIKTVESNMSKALKAVKQSVTTYTKTT